MNYHLKRVSDTLTRVNDPQNEPSCIFLLLKAVRWGRLGVLNTSGTTRPSYGRWVLTILITSEEEVRCTDQGITTSSNYITLGFLLNMSMTMEKRNSMLLYRYRSLVLILYSIFRRILILVFNTGQKSCCLYARSWNKLCQKRKYLLETWIAQELRNAIYKLNMISISCFCHFWGPTLPPSL